MKVFASIAILSLLKGFMASVSSIQLGYGFGIELFREVQRSSGDPPIGTLASGTSNATSFQNGCVREP